VRTLFVCVDLDFPFVEPGSWRELRCSWRWRDAGEGSAEEAMIVEGC
jgi:hypothetical protein